MKKVLLLFLLSAITSAGLAQEVSLLQQSWDLVQRRDYRAAAAGYGEFSRQNPADPRAPVALFDAASLILVELGDSSQAKVLLQELIIKYPDTKWTAAAYSLLGEIALGQNNLEEAAAFFQQGLRQARGAGYEMPASWIAQVVANWRTTLSPAAEAATQVQRYQEVVQHLPPGEEAAQIRFELAQALKKTNRSAEAAEVLAQLMYAYPYTIWTKKALEEERELVNNCMQFPWEDVEKMSRVMPLVNAREFEQAKEICSDISARYQGTPLAENADYGLVSFEAYLAGDFRTAFSRMQEYQRKYPQGLRAREAAQRIEAWGEILRLQETLEENSADYGTAAQLGFALLNGRFLPQAEKYFLQALQDTSADDAYLGLGYVYMLMNQPENGIRYLEHYLQNHPTDGSIHYQVGYACMSLGQLDKALQCFARYRELEPDNANAYDSYAECLMTMGRTEAAIAEYSRALELNPQFSNPYFMLGEIYAQKGESEKAAGYYHKYLELDPSGFQSAQAQAKLESFKKN